MLYRDDIMYVLPSLVKKKTLPFFFDVSFYIFRTFHLQFLLGERIQSENACSGASVELDGLYFVYLHHEKITLNVNKKTIMMETQHKFCFIVDVCKEEPQLVVPRDNYGKLETIFSFTELQAMGWLVQVKSIGFR